MTAELRQACAKAIHVVTTEGRTYRAGRAAMFILANTGWGWFARMLSWPPFVWFVELGYFIVARNRRFFGKFLFRKE